MWEERGAASGQCGYNCAAPYSCARVGVQSPYLIRFTTHLAHDLELLDAADHQQSQQIDECVCMEIVRDVLIRKCRPAGFVRPI